MRRILLAAIPLAVSPILAAESEPKRPPAENPESEAFFRAADGDRDGFLTVSEYTAYLLARAGAAANLSEERRDAAERIVRAYVADKDKDRDGRLSLREFLSPGDDALSAMFASADTDHDGRATEAEIRVSVRKAVCGDAAPTEEQKGTIDRRTAEVFSMFDFDGDGVVSFIEMKLFAKIEASAPPAPDMDAGAVAAFLDKKPDFAALDLNGDGTLTAPEITAWMRLRLRHAGPAHTEAFRRKGAVLADYDADGDGRISKAEWDAGVNAREPESAEGRADRLSAALAALTFADLDANRDGVVSAEEERAALAALARSPQDVVMLTLFSGTNWAARRDGSGRITRAAWREAREKSRLESLRPAIHERFATMDADHDGMVTAEELLAYSRIGEAAPPGEEKLKEMREGVAAYVGETDRNADGKISRDEYVAAVLDADRERERRENLPAEEAKLDAILAKHPLSAADRDAYAAKHKSMDADGDGRVTLAELTLTVKTMAAESKGSALSDAENADAEKGCAMLVASFDRDGDDAFSLKEYLVGVALSAGDDAKK